MNRKILFPIIALLSVSVLFVSACSNSIDLVGVKNNGENRSDYDDRDEPENIDMPTIGIYNGKGSWNLNVMALENFLDQYAYTWSVFDEQDILENNLAEQFDILWFPGGFAAEYKHFIPEHPNISSFIENGGLYIGSCAGAYYAADILQWLGTDYEYPLKIFEGRALGPMAGMIGWGETASIKLEDNHPASRGFDSTLDFYYFDGPYFEPYDHAEIEVLARYSINMQPAVIAGNFGDGKYLLLGPHPELGGYTVESDDYDIDGDNGAEWSWLNSVLLWFIQY